MQYYFKLTKNLLLYVISNERKNHSNNSKCYPCLDTQGQGGDALVYREVGGSGWQRVEM